MQLISKWLDKEDLEQLKLTDEAAKFKATLKELDDALLQAKKTGFTQKIIEADNIRDSLLIGLNYVVKGMTYFTDSNISNMAEQVKTILSKYGKRIDTLPQREESAVIENILQDLQAEPIAGMLPQLGLSQWIPKLQEANTNFDSLYLARSEKEATFISGLTREQREKMQEHFSHLCRTIEAYAFIDGEDAYKTLADRINVEVAKIKQLVKSRKAKEEEENNEE
nr:MAG: hypothetical protein CSA94_00505 [Bacteroidota bacterium]